MIGTVVNNNQSQYEMMFGEITSEGKNNNIKKNNLDLVRLGVFMKDALDIHIRKTGKRDRMVFAWQTIVTTWTGYIMILSASGLYIMFEIDFKPADNLLTILTNCWCSRKNMNVKYGGFSMISTEKKKAPLTLRIQQLATHTLGTRDPSSAQLSRGLIK